jgi:hypothetical protein
VNGRIPVNRLQQRIQVFLQSEKMDQESFFHSFIEKRVPLLPKGEDAIRRLNNVGFLNLGISEKLSTL